MTVGDGAQFRKRRVGLRTQARQQRLLMARELAGRASARHPHRRLARPPATDESLVDVRNADPQQRGNLPHRPARRLTRNREEAYRVPAAPLTSSLQDPRVLAFLLVWFGVNLLFGLVSVSQTWR